MRRATTRRRTRHAALVAVFTIAIAGLSLGAQDAPPDANDPSKWPRSTTIYPTPEPFSLMWYDARHAAALIRRAGLLVVRTAAGRETIAVRSVEIVESGREPELPPAHRSRWTIHLNGAPLDWENTYIDWGGRPTNLQLLFTYRNQRPVPDAPYLLE